MQIIGFNFTKVSAERKEKLEGKLEVSQNIDIVDVAKEAVDLSKNEILKVSFKFTVAYLKDFAKLEFKGNILLLPTEEELKDFLKSWKSDKQLPNTHKIPLFNFIMSKCNVKALSLEDELALPLHIPTLPKFVSEQQKK